MRYSLWIVLILSLIFISACSMRAQNVYDLGSARQVAVNTILDDDTYIQYDGYDFKELVAEKFSCDTCYDFAYQFSIDKEYLPGIKGYTVDVSLKDNIVTSIKYTEISSSNKSLPAIQDRFDQFCENKCGDGLCNDNVCQDVDCICEESKDNCPEDC